MTRNELDEEADRATALLRGRIVKRVWRHRVDEVGIEFEDGTRFFVDLRDHIELSITGCEDPGESPDRILTKNIQIIDGARNCVYDVPLQFEEIGPIDVERLAAWLPQQRWPFHARPQVDETWVRERAAAGHFFGSDTRSFWVVQGSSTPLGIVRAFDLSDTTPLLDIRIADHARGRGLGTEVLRWVTTFVFENFPEIHRVGGYTRTDNLPMRRVFEKCGFLQEARHRQAWRVQDGAYADAVAYAALRSDWFTSDAKALQVVATVGGDVDEASVTLAIYGDTLEPERVTALLGCQPTSAHRKGDRKREGSVPSRTGAWLLSERGKPPSTVDDILNRVLAHLPEEADVWRRVADEFDLQIWFGIFVSEWNRGFTLSNHSLQRLATLGVSLNFDVYADELGRDL